jgi:mono/diheme cytochrome c family protein
MMKRPVVFAVVFALAGATAAAQGTPEAGKKAYDAKKCSQCHTIAGKGGSLTKLYPLDEVGAKTSAADIKSWLTDTVAMEAKSEKKPKLKMSSKKVPLTAAEVENLVAFMLTLKVAKGK